MSEMRKRIAKTFECVAELQGLALHYDRLNMADAVLDAMREPTKEMAELGMERLVQWDRSDEYDFYILAQEVWQAMIDEAKKHD